MGFSAIATASLELARSGSQSAKQERQRSVMLQLSEAMSVADPANCRGSDTATIAPLAATITHLAAALVSGVKASVYLVDAVNDELLVKVASTHPALMQISMTEKREGRSVLWKTLASGESVRVTADQANMLNKRGQIAYKGLDCYMCVAMKAHNQNVGVIEVR